MTKIVINNKAGSFRLSNEAYEYMIDFHGIPCLQNCQLWSCTARIIYIAEPNQSGDRYFEFWTDYNRSDPVLIDTVEQMSLLPDSLEAYNLKVVEIPDDVKWYISTDDYGREAIEEKHRTWK